MVEIYAIYADSNIKPAKFTLKIDINLLKFIQSVAAFNFQLNIHIKIYRPKGSKLTGIQRPETPVFF